MTDYLLAILALIYVVVAACWFLICLGIFALEQFGDYGDPDEARKAARGMLMAPFWPVAVGHVVLTAVDVARQEGRR